MGSHPEGRTLLRHESWDSPAMKARSVLDRTTSDIAEPDTGSMEPEDCFKNRSLQLTATVEAAAQRHIGFGGMPGEFRARPIAHGKVHIATLSVKTDDNGNRVPKDAPTSSACAPPAAFYSMAAGAFLDMAAAMPDLPRINCVGSDKSWLDEALEPLRQSAKQQHAPEVGNLCHDGVSANYGEALDPSPPGTPNDEYSSFLQSDTDLPQLNTIDILGQPFGHDSLHEADELSRLGLLGMLPGGDLFPSRDQAHPALYKLPETMLAPVGWRDGGATTSGADFAAHAQPLFRGGGHSQSEQSAVHYDGQHHQPQWQGLQTYKSTSASSPVLVEQGRGFSGDGSHSFGPQEAYTSPLNQARPGVPTPSSHYFDPSIYDLHTDQLPSFECLASRFVNHALHAHTAVPLCHPRIPLPVPYHDCPVDPSAISADMMDDHPSSYIHYEVPASNLDRQGNTPQSQRRPTKQHRSLLMLPADFGHCYGGGAEDHLSALSALESRPQKAKALKGGVTKGNGTSGRKSVRATCKICGTKKTPQWRCGPDGPRTLCNACGLKYRKGQLPGDDDPGADGALVDAQVELPEGPGGTLGLPPA